jgi:hypothetical protein
MIHDFIDGGGELVNRKWRGVFGGGYIFTRGTGVGAMYIMLPMLEHLARTFHRNQSHYLGLVQTEFPRDDWRSGSGRLSLVKGGGAGKKIVDYVFSKTIAELEDVPDADAFRFLDGENPKLLRKLEGLLRASNWKPFVESFVGSESGSGVYSVVCVDKDLERIVFRTGQATELRSRLGDHQHDLTGDLPEGVLPAFYTASPHVRTALNAPEKVLFHLVPPKLRIYKARHPQPCSICSAGIK